MSYPGHLGEFYPSAEMQLVYSAAPADLAAIVLDTQSNCNEVLHIQWSFRTGVSLPDAFYCHTQDTTIN